MKCRFSIALLALGALACESENSAVRDAAVGDGMVNPPGDCREAARECATGFTCIEANGEWQCALLDDGGVADAPRVDARVVPPDSGVDAGADAESPDVAADVDVADEGHADAASDDLGSTDAEADLDLLDPDAGGDAAIDPDADPGPDPDMALAPDACPAFEACNGADDDCDDVIDEDAECEAGVCLDGECVVLAPPAAACEDNADCESDDCVVDDGVPGGFCYQQCRDSGDCYLGLCLEVNDGARHCWARCHPEDESPCRDGWVCQPLDDEFAFCAVDCNAVPCGAGEVCDEDSGLCVPGERLISLSVEQVLVMPGKIDGTKWDGLGNVPRRTFDAVADALTEDDAFNAVLVALGEAAILSVERPDCYGTASLLINGPANPDNDFDLPIRQDSLTPIWGVTWNGVPFGPDDEIRVRLELFDSDILGDDDVGVVTIGHEDIEAALDAGEVFPVQVNRQSPQILFVSISAIEIEE